MGWLLVLFCNVRSCVIDLSYIYLYLHDLCHTMSDIFAFGIKIALLVLLGALQYH